MANQEQVERLSQGVDVWNDWRRINPSVKPNLKRISLKAFDLKGVNFSKADLQEANLRASDLGGADLCWARLQNANLSETDFFKADLEQADFRNVNLSGALLDMANLSYAKLSKACLMGASLIDTDIFESNFINADLSKAHLIRVKAVRADFTGSKFTGACIEDWNISNETKLDDIECDYIYLKYPDQERRPSDPNRNFEPGEFKALVQKALNTVDLIFRNGVDWQALLISLEKLRVETVGTELSIQAIENKDDGAFVVRVNTPPEADKAKVEKFLKREYEAALKTLEAKYASQLQIQGEKLTFYREELAAKRQDNTHLMGVIQVMAENQAPKYDMRGSNIGNFVDTAQAGSQQSNVQFITMSQDLSQAAQQIQDLLNQLQKNGVSVEVAQEQVATDLANQAKKDPTTMGKLVKWGQALANKAGETTVSEAAKAVVPLALKLLGIPL